MANQRKKKNFTKYGVLIFVYEAYEIFQSNGSLLLKRGRREEENLIKI